MRHTQRRCLSAGGVVFAVVLLAVSCVSTTPLGRVKEALLYDRDNAVGLYEQTVKLYLDKQISDADFARATVAYRAWQAAHNSVVYAVDMLERDLKQTGISATDPLIRQRTFVMEQARLAAQAALVELTKLLMELGVLK